MQITCQVVLFLWFLASIVGDIIKSADEEKAVDAVGSLIGRWLFDAACFFILYQAGAFSRLF